MRLYAILCPDMSRRTIILGMILAVLLLVLVQRHGVQEEFQKGPAIEPVLQEMPEEPQPVVQTNTSLLSEPVDMRRFEDWQMPAEQSLYDKLLSMVDREMLEKYEGSYTKEDLTSSEGDGSLSFSLSSSWLLSSSNLPTAGLRVRLNPQTKEYEVVGGEFYLPKSGFGISHETDQESGERKSFLNMKKTF